MGIPGRRWLADDIALLAQTPVAMKRILASVEAEAASVGLRFNPSEEVCHPARRCRE